MQFSVSPFFVLFDLISFAELALNFIVIRVNSGVQDSYLDLLRYLTEQGRGCVDRELLVNKSAV